MEKKRELLIRPARPAPSPKGKSYFFGVGINAYTHFPKLNNAVKDATDLAKLMQKKYDLDEVILITDAEATHDNIITQLDKLKQKVTQNDKLLIFYSGHGHLDSSEKGYWIPIDAARESTANYIRNSTLRDYIEDIPSLHTLLISDACFSGSLFVRGVSRSTRAAEELEKLKSRWAICSGRHDEEVFDGKPGGNSPFTGSILKSLRNNNSPKLKVSHLADEVTELTRANYKQLPEGNPIFGVGHDGGQYIFCLKADEAADWKSCKEAGTLAAYQAHMKHYPDGQYAEEALWQIARLQNTLRAYDDYLDRYLNGRYSDEAQKRSRSLQEDADWQQALRFGDLPSLRKYERKYPHGKYVQEASKRIDQLREGQPVTARSQMDSGRSESTSQAAVKTKIADPKPKTSKAPWIIAGVSVVTLIIVIWVLQSRNSGYDLPLTEIEFETMHHDFGELPLGESVPFTFVFRNTGKVPLEIIDLEADPATSIGFYPKEPIMPGEKGEIQVLFAVPTKLRPIDKGEMSVASELLVHANVEYSPFSLSMGAFVRGEGGGELEVRPGLKRDRIVPEIQREEDLWQKVQEENTPESFQHYLDLYPQGRFKNEAIEKRDTRHQLLMIEDDYFNEVRSKNSLEGYEAYLQQFPDGKYVKEASEAVRRLKRK